MNFSLPRVGVVIRTKDRPLFVTRALASVLDQSFADWRIALVNDGGEAEMLQKALEGAGLTRRVPSDRLTVIHHPQSIGRSDAFNRGVEALETEFICCLDDDDSWHPDFLTSLVGLYDRTQPLAADLGGVASMVTAIREEIVTDKGTEIVLKLGEDDLPNAFKRRDFFVDPIAYVTYRHDLYPVQWMLRRDAVIAAGGFPSAFNVMEDRAFMAQFLQRWRLAFLDQPLAYHHRRVQRRDDTARTTAMNTLDNPSYDWRLYADLAKPPVNSSADAPAGRDEILLRATAASIVKELNDETSALWHKVNGEASSLRSRIDALDARLSGQAPRAEITVPLERKHWSLWDVVGETDLGFKLGAGTAFLERLELSLGEARAGLLMHAARWNRQMVVQIPRTDDWAALELSLKGLAPRAQGLRCELVVSHPQGYLFETALSQWRRDRLGRKAHAFDLGHVHACPAGGSVHVVREFSAEELARGDDPKLSIALPRQALDFRFICHDLVVSRL